MTDKSIEADQKHFDRAYEFRERRRAQLSSPDYASAGANPSAAAGIRAGALSALEGLRGSSEAVAFGRIDEAEGDTYYVGYDLIMDERRNPLVVSWQTDVGSRFYRASAGDPLGLALKRIYETSVNTIIEVHDDVFGGKAAADEPYEEYLLRELSGHRSGRMHDIVRTLQAHQDEVMRMPADQTLVIEGGPGSGKTIVGLQRISILLFRGDTSIQDVAFIGPTPGYLRYISSVLPSLGAEDVRHLSLTTLAPAAPNIAGVDSPEAHAVKGDARMRELITRAVADRRHAPEDPVEVAVGRHVVVLQPEFIWEVMRSVEESGNPHLSGRAIFAERLAHAISEKSAQSQTRTPVTVQEVLSSQEFQNLLNRTWPRMTPAEALRDLLSSERRLEELSWSLFDASEAATLFRPAQQRLSDEQWTVADIALLDAFAEELNGPPEKRFGHVMVDEVQDLSPMQLASVARRSSNGVMTLLGDIGQGFGPFARTDWDQLLSDLGLDGSYGRMSLDVSYRVPASILDAAGAVARAASIPVTVPRPIRTDGATPTSVDVAPSDVWKALVAEVRRFLNDGLSVGVITGRSDINRAAAAFEYEGIAFTDGREELGSGVTLIPAVDVRGLEFDACVIVEPSTIVGDVPHGMNLLYVAMTRPTRRLSIVHSQRLPGPLADILDRPPTEGRPEGSSTYGGDSHAQGAPEDASSSAPGAEGAEWEPDPVASPRVDRAIAILRLVAQGHTYDQVLNSIPDATYVEIFNAADLGREALVSNQRRSESSRAGFPWDHEEESQLKAELDAGHDIETIAERHGRTRGAISSRIGRMVDEGRLPEKYRIDLSG